MANKSDWGWESEFLKVEFINSETRSEFDKEVEKVKNSYEDLNDAVSAIWHLIEHFDKIKKLHDQQTYKIRIIQIPYFDPELPNYFKKINFGL